MGVGIQSNVHTSVAQPLTNYLRVDSQHHHHSRMGMPEVVEPYPCDARGLRNLGKSLGHLLGIQRGLPGHRYGRLLPLHPGSQASARHDVRLLHRGGPGCCGQDRLLACSSVHEQLHGLGPLHAAGVHGRQRDQMGPRTQYIRTYDDLFAVP